MDFSKTITVIGGDERQKYIYNYLKGMGIKVFSYKIGDCENNFVKLSEAIADSDIIIGPVLMEKYIDIPEVCDCLKPGQIFASGNISEELINCCNEKDIFYYDYMKSENLYACNAVLTGEGVLCAIIKDTPFALNNAKALIIGYGKCGSVISSMLGRLGCIISIVDNDFKAAKRAAADGFAPCYIDVCVEMAQKNFDKYDFIVNTVPDVVLDTECLSKLQPDCVLFDIASKSGFDDVAIENNGLKLVKLPGLPGRFSPKTAGELIAKDILQNLSSLI